ncbi:hypothetical protein BQ8794_130018 [Mesorhizobium prunaredense]|uniref:Uncharacterized protein n=1 Tax=Mesorhizobium prunaredense TaxID=1631249 RepID=A0A1R3V572_9HYPH|nr:hypothetical protein [Mesorhizobium prunaredense]SIT53534.1 hypothetical protein BQ8794_130018 [Mesorhizobium prunaredense]
MRAGQLPDLQRAASDEGAKGSELYFVFMAMARGFQWWPSRPEMVEHGLTGEALPYREPRRQRPMASIAALQENFFDGKRDKSDRTQRRDGDLGLPTQRLEPSAAPALHSQNGWAVSNFIIQALEPITIYGS